MDDTNNGKRTRMANDETIRFEGDNMFAALFDVALHTNALIGTVFQMQAQILAKLNNQDPDEVFEKVYADYEQMLKSLLVELGVKHGEILIDLSKMIPGARAHDRGESQKSSDAGPSMS